MVQRHSIRINKGITTDMTPIKEDYLAESSPNNTPGPNKKLSADNLIIGSNL
jgi:hypothetical protein